MRGLFLKQDEIIHRIISIKIYLIKTAFLENLS